MTRRLVWVMVLVAGTLWATGCDGEKNTGGDCDGCLIDDVCYDDQAENPANPCQACDVAQAANAWSDADGAPCADGLYCNGDDTCSGGSCVDHVGDPCTAPDICNESSDSCEASCSGCLIDSTCFDNGDANPTNGCQICTVATSTTTWTDNDGASCSDDVFCNGADTCSGGTCSVHPGDPCSAGHCDAASDTCFLPEIQVSQGASVIPSGNGIVVFPRIDVGTTTAITLAIQNLGQGDLTLTLPPLVTGDVAHFSLNINGTSAVLTPDGTTLVDVIFNPGNGGAKTATVSITNDDADEAPYTFTIAGNSTPNTWREITPTTGTANPLARIGHALAYMDNGKVLMFGGMTNDSTLVNDTWEFDLDAGTWTEIVGSVAPTMRFMHAMAYDGVGKVVLFGGTMIYSASEAVTLAETWEYDVATQTWAQVTGPTTPASRGGHRLLYVGADTLMMFGGATSDTPTLGIDLDDTWMYTVSSGIWTQAVVSATPLGRSEYSMAYDGLGTVVLTGGYRADGNLRPTDLWEFSMTTGDWDQIHATGMPPSVSQQMASLGQGEILYFDSLDFSSDTFLYDTTTGTLTDLAPVDIPSLHQINGYLVNFDMVSVGEGKVILIGGTDTYSSAPNAVRDVWEFVR